MDHRYPGLQITNEIVSAISFYIISILEIIVFVKLRFKLDLFVILLMLSFIVIFLLRVVQSFVEQPPDFVTILLPVAYIICCALMYYFVFEMMFIVSTIKSMSPTDRMERNEGITRIKIAVFTLYFALYTPSTLFGDITYKFNPQLY